MNKGQRALSLKEEGKSNQEIADLLGMSAKSVRRLVSEARSRRDYLGEFSRSQSVPGIEHLSNGWGQAVQWDIPWASVPKPRPFPQDDHAMESPPVNPPSSGEIYTTHLVIPDTQCRPDVPLDHLLWAGKYIKEREPDVVVHLGDHWDFPSLSSYEKPGSKWFEGKRVLADIEAGNRGLELLEEGMGGFKPKRKILLRGNHCFRLTRFINDNPQLEGLFGFDSLNDISLGWEVVPFLEVISVNDIWYSHYFANPLTGKPYGGMPDTMLKQIGHSFTMGHRQGRREASRYLADGSEQRGLVVGSFYQHTEDYLGAQGNHHWRGLIVKHEVRAGTYDMMEVSMNYLRKRFK